MNAFDYTVAIKANSVIITKYIGNDKHVTLPQTLDDLPVKVIGKKAFFGADIESVMLPDTLEVIEELAFSRCANLAEISFPPSVRLVEKSAFADCGALARVERSSENIIFSANTFYKTKLTSFTLPTGMKYVPQALLARCHHLIYVIIPEGTLSLGRAVFGHDEALKKVFFPSSLKEIHPEVFALCDDFCIQVKAGSYAEQFCREHGFKMEII